MRAIYLSLYLFAYVALGLLIIGFFGGIATALVGQALTIGGLIAGILLAFALAFGAVGAALVLTMASETADQLTRNEV